MTVCSTGSAVSEKCYLGERIRYTEGNAIKALLLKDEVIKRKKQITGKN